MRRTRLVCSIPLFSKSTLLDFSTSHRVEYFEFFEQLNYVLNDLILFNSQISCELTFFELGNKKNIDLSYSCYQQSLWISFGRHFTWMKFKFWTFWRSSETLFFMIKFWKLRKLFDGILNMYTKSRSLIFLVYPSIFVVGISLHFISFVILLRYCICTFYLNCSSVSWYILVCFFFCL